MWVWAYGIIHSCRPEMDLYLVLLPAVFVVMLVLYTLLLQVHIRASWLLKACSKARFKASVIDCSIACLRELCFEQSSVFHRKLFADGKL